MSLPPSSPINLLSPGCCDHRPRQTPALPPPPPRTHAAKTPALKQEGDLQPGTGQEALEDARTRKGVGPREGPVSSSWALPCWDVQLWAEPRFCHSAA